MFSFLCFLLCFLGPQWWHTEVPRLGVEQEPQLLAYATATATPDQSCTCDLHHSSWQHWILNPLSGAMDEIHILMDLAELVTPEPQGQSPLFFRAASAACGNSWASD